MLSLVDYTVSAPKI